jgi:hypothetical protein
MAYKQYPKTATRAELREIARKQICRYGVLQAYMAVHRRGLTKMEAITLVEAVYDDLRCKSVGSGGGE